MTRWWWLLIVAVIGVSFIVMMAREDSSSTVNAVDQRPTGDRQPVLVELFTSEG